MIYLFKIDTVFKQDELLYTRETSDYTYICSLNKW